MTPESPEPDPRYLFVYGTLRCGGRAPAALRSLLRARGRKVGEGVVDGRLRHAGAYPAALEPTDETVRETPASDGEAAGGDGKESVPAVGAAASRTELREPAEIRGAVFLLEEPDEVLRALDGYEGVEPGEEGLFRRGVAEVRLDEGRRVRAWIYWYNRDPEGLPVIPGGDWSRARGGGTPELDG